MMRKSRITLSKPKTAASRKETHERVNEHAEKATGSRREIEDRYSTQGEFPSSSCLIRNAGKERARRRTRLHICTYTHVRYPVCARYIPGAAALINMHSRSNIYRRRLLLEACAMRGARARLQILDKSTVKPETSLYRLTSCLDLFLVKTWCQN